MNKPLSVAKQDFEKSLESLVNESGLPALVLRYIFQDALTQLCELEKQQYEKDLEEYNSSEEETCS